MSWHDATIHRDIPQAQYHAWPANQRLQPGSPDWTISRSELLRMLECGEMFLAGGREVSGKSVAIGSLVDCLLTCSREEFAATYAVQPATYQKEVTKGRGDKKVTTTVEMPWTAQSNTCRAWAEEQREAGRQVVSYRDYREAQEMCLEVRRKQPMAGNNLTLGQLIDASEKQVVVTAMWRDSETGRDVPCRCMIDLCRGLDKRVRLQAYDLKTAQEVSRRKFGFSIRDYGYDVQAWMYSTMLAAAMDCEWLPFGFLAVRNSRPYLVATYRASMETRAWGEEKFRAAMRAYCDALEDGFGGYTNGFEEI